MAKLHFGAKPAALLAVVLAMLVLSACSGTKVRVVEGYVNGVNESGTAIGLSPSPDDTKSEGYIIAGAAWRDPDGAWHDTFPTCLDQSSTGVQMRLGLVDVPPNNDAPGRAYVVWLECLTSQYSIPGL